MEETMMKKDSRFTITTAASPPPPAALGVQRNPHTITKARPKIRIIHIFAPEIIKTDVANFRELVQRLTGKPTENNHSRKKKKSTRKIPNRNVDCATAAVARMFPQKAMKMEGVRGGLHHERVKGEEEEMWRGVNPSGGGFLGGFGEIEGFMDQFSHEYPLFPVASATTQMDVYAGSQFA